MRSEAKTSTNTNYENPTNGFEVYTGWRTDRRALFPHKASSLLRKQQLLRSSGADQICKHTHTITSVIRYLKKNLFTNVLTRNSDVYLQYSQTSSFTQSNKLDSVSACYKTKFSESKFQQVKFVWFASCWL